MSTVHEIVRVLDEHSLIDAESYQRSYATAADQPLTPGFYLVIWPPEMAATKYDDRARYFGPFQCRQYAEEKLAGCLDQQALISTWGHGYRQLPAARLECSPEA
jgi:hypothetical protein